MIGKPVFKSIKGVDYYWLNECKSPLAIIFLEQFNEWILQTNLIRNEYAMHLIIELDIMNKYKHLRIDISSNIGAIKYLEKNQEYVDSLGICKNQNAIDFLKKHPKYITTFNIFHLCKNHNPEAISIIKKYNLNKEHWYALSSNPNAIDLLEENISKIDFRQISLNNNPRIIKIIEENMDKYDRLGCKFTSNPNLIKLIEKYVDRISEYDNGWYGLLFNVNARKLIEENLNKVKKYLKNLDVSYWTYSRDINLEFILPYIIKYNRLQSGLLGNRYVFHYADVVNNIIPYDYEKMLSNNKEFTEELVAYVFNPKRLLKLCDTYNIEFLDYIDLY